MSQVLKAGHGTLVANTVTQVTVQTGRHIQVINRSGTAEIYFTVNGVTPTVGGSDCYVVPAAIMSQTVGAAPQNVVVSLISTGTPTFSVIGG